MDYVHHLLPALVPVLMTMLVILVVTILYNARRKLPIKEDSNKHQKAQKIPEEHDERFATGKRLIHQFTFSHLMTNS